jgi:hypothetical protein
MKASVGTDPRVRPKRVRPAYFRHPRSSIIKLQKKMVAAPHAAFFLRSCEQERFTLNAL